VRLRAACLLLTAFLLSGQDPGNVRYEDSKGRFSFDYPLEFGATSVGTNDGHGGRVAAIRFRDFSSRVTGRSLVLGGEAALTRGFPLFDLQAAGGLYDEITLEIFPPGLREKVLRQLPAVGPLNLCRAIGETEHLNGTEALFAGLSSDQRDAIRKVEGIRNAAPKVLQCVVDGDTVTFDKEVSFERGGPRQHVYGAVRFLKGAYSTFQLIRGESAPPERKVLAQMTAVVKSWRGKQ